MHLITNKTGKIIAVYKSDKNFLVQWTEGGTEIIKFSNKLIMNLSKLKRK
jgi:hypothetical protein